MKKAIYFLVALGLGYYISTRFVELAYSLGFAELKKEVVLMNDEKLKVKCRSYALGFFDEIKLENKFQTCVNEYESAGYIAIESTRISIPKEVKSEY